MSKPNTPSYKTLNWPAYNKALKRRGSLTIWFDPGMVWAAKPTSCYRDVERGEPFRHRNTNFELRDPMAEVLGE